MSPAPVQKAGPPKPEAVLAVGVVGHRLNRLPGSAIEKVRAEVSRTLRKIVAEIEAVAARNPELLTTAKLALMTSLAEGADRLAARAFLNLESSGVVRTLSVPLPFAPTDYAADFADTSSTEEFYALLERADAIMQLPGVRSDAAQAYEMAGLTVVGQSDLLIAVWDGLPSAGRGGTAEMVAAAVARRVPIVHIHANGRQEPTLRWAGLADQLVEIDRFEELPSRPADAALAALVDTLLRPPQAAERKDHDDGQRARLDRYLKEQRRRLHWSLAFPLLTTLAGRRPQRTDFIPLSPAVAAAGLAAGPLGDPPARLAKAYGWADALASYFAQVFRGAFTVNFVLAAAAVGCAALTIVQHDWKKALLVIELALLAILLGNTMLGQRARWHARWFEARELAERFRAALPLWAVGLRPSDAVDDEPTWTGWYARAVVRAEGLRNAKLDAAGLDAAAAGLRAILTDQQAYHRRTAARMAKLERRLERIGTVCFWLTIVLAGAFLSALLAGYKHVDGEGPDWGMIEAALTAALPAFATAFYGIRVTADLEGIHERSERMADQLDGLIRAIGQGPHTLLRLRSVALRASDTLLGEVSRWRLVAEGRRLAVPG